jgi:hypothetical protein
MTVLRLVTAIARCARRRGTWGADFSIQQVSEMVLPGAGCFVVKFVYAQHDTSLYIFSHS